jgi:RNA polymerase sigma factor (sigma-70 family)
VVYVVDDDEAVRDAVGTFLRQAGFHVKAYDSGKAFLSAFSPQDLGCVVLDLSMPEMDGFEVQKQLVQSAARIPVIFMTAFGTVRDSVSAIKAGAFDFLEKPCSRENLLACIQEAIREAESARLGEQIEAEGQARFDSLSPRERQILGLIAQGLSSKQIARRLEISPRTVDAHRARLMIKMQASSMAELGVMAARHQGIAEPAS